MKHRRSILIIIGLVVIIGGLVVLRPRGQRAPTSDVDEKPEVYVQRGLRSSVPSTDWSRDGRLILSSDGDVVMLWDAGSSRQIRVFESSSQSSATVLFMPDGKQFVFGGPDSTIQVWDVATFKPVKRFRVDAPVQSFALTAKGDRLLCTTLSPTAYLWDLKKGKVERKFPTAAQGSLVAAISPDGEAILLAGSLPKSVTLWNAETGQKVRDFTMSKGIPVCGAFSPDGARIACGSGDRMDLMGVRAWGWSGSRVHPDSAEVRVWNTDGGLVCELPQDSAFAVLSVQFDTGGRQLITTAIDSVVSWWDIESGRLSSEFTSRPDHLVQTALFSPDRKRMLTAGDENMLIWDLARKEVVKAFNVPIGSDGRAGLSEDGKKILAADYWGHSTNREFSQYAYVWDATTGIREEKIDPIPERYRYLFSRDCRFAAAQIRTAVPAEYRLQFWSSTHGVLGTTSLYRKMPIYGSWDFTDDGRYFANCIGDSAYVLWDTATGKELRRIYCSQPPYIREQWVTGIDKLSLSDDGKYAVAGRQPAQLLLDFTTGESEIIRCSRDGTPGRQPVGRSSSDSTTANATCSFAPDGQRAAFSWYDHSVDVWDVPNRKLLYSFVVDGFGDAGGLVSTIACSRDGRTFAGFMSPRNIELVTSDSGKVDTLSWFTPRGGAIWDFQTGKLLKRFGGNGSALMRVEPSMDERFLVATCMSSGTRLYNRENGKEVIQLMSFENGEWLAVTPEGYYTASLNGDQYLNVRAGTRMTGIEPYRSTFYQPKVVEAALRLRDSEKAIAEVLGCKDVCTTIADLPDMEPPFLNVKYPEDGDTLSNADTTLAFHVEDRRTSIKSVKVFVNGRPVSGSSTRDVEKRTDRSGVQLEVPKDQKTLDLKVPLRLDEGDNLVTITALGKSEAVDSLHLYVVGQRALPEQMETDTVWILAVGINKYQDKKLQSLKYCQNDAQGMIQAFQAQEGKTCQKVMSLCISDAGPKKPTYETIVDNIGFLQQAADHDLVILFLAGHGVNDTHGDFYFLPSDAEVTGPQEFKKSKAISGAQLQTAVDVSARRFVFVDACHSAEVGVDLVKLAREFKDNRVLIMTSSEGSKPSEEADSLKHGLFTYAMIKGLQGEADIIGSDGRVSATELIAYVSDRVSAMTRQRQNPVFWAPGGLSNFVVAEAKPQVIAASR